MSQDSLAVPSSLVDRKSSEVNSEEPTNPRSATATTEVSESAVQNVPNTRASLRITSTKASSSESRQKFEGAASDCLTSSSPAVPWDCQAAPIAAPTAASTVAPAVVPTTPLITAEPSVPKPEMASIQSKAVPVDRPSKDETPAKGLFQQIIGTLFTGGRDTVDPVKPDSLETKTFRRVQLNRPSSDFCKVADVASKFGAPDGVMKTPKGGAVHQSADPGPGEFQLHGESGRLRSLEVTTQLSKDFLGTVNNRVERAEETITAEKPLEKTNSTVQSSPSVSSSLPSLQACNKSVEPFRFGCTSYSAQDIMYSGYELVTASSKKENRNSSEKVADDMVTARAETNTLAPIRPEVSTEDANGVSVEQERQQKERNNRERDLSVEVSGFFQVDSTRVETPRNRGSDLCSRNNSGKMGTSNTAAYFNMSSLDSPGHLGPSDSLGGEATPPIWGMAEMSPMVSKMNQMTSVLDSFEDMSLVAQNSDETNNPDAGGFGEMPSHYRSSSVQLRKASQQPQRDYQDSLLSRSTISNGRSMRHTKPESSNNSRKSLCTRCSSTLYSMQSCRDFIVSEAAVGRTIAEACGAARCTTKFLVVALPVLVLLLLFNNRCKVAMSYIDDVQFIM